MYKLLLFIFLITPQLLLAALSPTFMTYHGRIIAPSTLPLENSNVTFTLQILSPGTEQCVLYEETHTLDMTGSQGLFSFNIGEGAVSVNDPGLGITGTVSNNSSKTGLTCSTGTSYTPTAGDSRLLRVTFDYPGSTGPVTISPETKITSSPYSTYASMLEGLGKDEFLQVNSGGLNALNQANIESVFTTTNYPLLTSAIDGTHTAYAKTSDLPVTGGTLDMSGGGQDILVTDTPASGDSVVNKDYSDLHLGGKIIDTTSVAGLTDSAGDGFGLIWDEATETFVAGTLSSTDNTKLPLAGGTMSGNIDMDENDIIDIGDLTGIDNLDLIGSGQADFNGSNLIELGFVTIMPERSIHMGTFTNAQEITYTGTLGAPDEGKLWYNSDSNELKLWDGASAIATGVQIGTTAGTAMSASSVPNCTGSQKLQMSAGPMYTWSCVTESGNILDGGNTNGAAITIGTNDNFDLAFETNGSTAMTILDTGEVGVGTISPASLFEVEKNQNATTDITITNTDTGASSRTGLFINSGGSDYGYIGVYSDTFASTYYQDKFVFFPGSTVDGGMLINTQGKDFDLNTGATTTTSRLFLEGSSGHIGLGTTSPDNQLHIYSATTNRNLLVESGTTSSGLTLESNGKEWDLFNSVGIANQGFGIYDRTNTVYRLAIDGTSGNVGIGINSPTRILHLNNTNVNGTMINFDNDDAGGNSWVVGSTGSANSPGAGHYAFYNNNGTAYTMVLTESNRVGIGDETPETRLDVEGTLKIANGGETCSVAADAGMFRYNSGNMEFCNGSAWQALGTGTGDGDILDGGNTEGAAITIGTNDNFDLNFETNGSNAMIIKSDGDVGIGTTSPSGKVHISTNNGGPTPHTSADDLIVENNTGPSGISILSSGANGSNIFFGDTASNLQGKLQYDNAIDAMIFETNATEAMRIDSSGRLGIGTTIPGELLHVNTAGARDNIKVGSWSYLGGGPAGYPYFGFASVYTGTQWDSLHSSVPGMMLNYSASGLDISTLPANTTNATATRRVTILNTGNVGIGETSPDTSLDVSGTIKLANGGEACSVAGHAGMFRYNSGNMEFCNGSAWQTLGTGTGSGDILDGGNTEAADITIGTNDNFDLNFETNGSTQLTVDTSGNVGIGNTTPDQLLHIDSGAAATSQIHMESNSGGANSYLKSWFNGTEYSFSIGSGALPEILTLGNGTGHVGIGTPTPSTPLHIDANSPGLLRLERDTTTDSFAAIQLHNTSSGGSHNSSFGSKAETTLSDSYTYISGDDTSIHLAVRRDGHVGIGTTSPQAQLHVLDTGTAGTPAIDSTTVGVFQRSGSASNRSRVSVIAGTSGRAEITFGDSSDPLESAISYSNTADRLQLEIAGAPRLYIANTGRTGVGEPSPDTLLDVAGTIKVADGGETCTIAADAGMFRYNTGNMEFCNGSSWQTLSVGGGSGDILNGGNTGTVTIGSNTNNELRFETDNTVRMRMLGTGEIGIGITNPTEALQIGATSKFKVGGLSEGLEIDKDSNFSNLVSLANGFLFQIDRVDASYSDFVFNHNNSVTTDNELMRLTGDGNLGIGVINPNSTLDIFSASPGTSTDYVAQIEASDYQFGISNGTDLWGFSNFSGNLYFQRNGANALTLAGSAAAGFGDTGPDAHVEISANGTSGGAVLMVSSNDGGDGDLFIVNEDGNVGIGIVGPAAPIHVSSTSASVLGQFDSSLNAALLDINTSNGTPNRSGVRFLNAGTVAGQFHYDHADSRLELFSGGSGAGDRKMVILNSGNIGIGNDSPNSTLDIDGDFNMLEMSSAPTVSAADEGRIYFDATANKFKVSENGGAFVDLVPTSGAGAGDIIDGGNSEGAAVTIGTNDNFDLNLEANGSTVMTIENDGDVGIGLTSPAKKLHVFEAVGGDTLSRLQVGDSLGVYQGFQNSAQTWVIGINSNEDFIIRDSTNASAIPFEIENGAPEGSLFVDSTGNVGVGTSNPSSILDIVSEGTTDVNYTMYSSAAALTAPDFVLKRARNTKAAPQAVLDNDKLGGVRGEGYDGSDFGNYTGVFFFADGNFSPGDTPTRIEFDTMPDGTSTAQTRMTIKNSGNIGIGETSPDELLHISAPSSGTHLKLETLNSAGSFIRYQNSAHEWSAGINSAENYVIRDQTNSQNEIVEIENGAPAGTFRIDSSGDVGIGTTSPASQLHVDATGAGGGVCVTSDGTCSAVPNGGEISAETTLNTGADYAEYFEAEESIEKGELVALNPKTGLARRFQVGDQLIGVVSTNPGVIGNSELKNSDRAVLVALVGQVPVVDAQIYDKDGYVYTKSGEGIGYRLANNNVYLNISTGTQSLQRKINSLQTELKKLNNKYYQDIISVKGRLDVIEKQLTK